MLSIVDVRYGLVGLHAEGVASQFQPHWATFVPVFSPWQEEGGEVAAVFVQFNLMVSLDGVKLGKDFCACWNVLDYFIGARKEVD